MIVTVDGRLTLLFVQSKVASQQAELVSAMELMAALVNRSSTPALFRTLAELDLSFTRVKALFTLGGGERSVGGIGAALGSSLPPPSRAAAGLPHRGFVVRGGERSWREIGAAPGPAPPAPPRRVNAHAHREFVGRGDPTGARRSKLVALTPRGRDVLEACVAGRRAAMEQFVASLSEPERSALHSALLPIVERIGSRDGSHPPL